MSGSSAPALKFLLLAALTGVVCAEPITFPYLQDLSESSATLAWVDTQSQSVKVTWLNQSTYSKSKPAPELNFNPWEKSEYPETASAPNRFQHTVLLAGLPSGTPIDYTVEFPQTPFTERFRTLPTQNQVIRLIAYSDSETEPESTGKPAKWESRTDPKRRYPVDQTMGYAQNLLSIKARQPTAILIAGDLVESGGEQRDWDEFWRHNRSLAGSIPLWTCPGNHEYFAGPKSGAYEKQSSRWAISKYRTYFPTTANPKYRYYQREVGPVTVLSLDSNDGWPANSANDTNHYLDATGDFAPGCHPQSPQIRWLEERLKVAQRQNRLIVVMFHHCPYSSGEHGRPPGNGPTDDPQSGQPMRTLTPLFLRYGVDLVITGHDEMFERSTIEGQEVLPNGKSKPTRLQVYDVGIGGDGLRGPYQPNEWRQFLANSDAPELWQNNVLMSGGRHYGHLEIDVQARKEGWTAKLTPVYLLPVPLLDGKGFRFERREYPDSLILQE